MCYGMLVEVGWGLTSTAPLCWLPVGQAQEKWEILGNFPVDWLRLSLQTSNFLGQMRTSRRDASMEQGCPSATQTEAMQV